MGLARREFAELLAVGTVLSSTGVPELRAGQLNAAAAQDSPHIGTLYPFVQQQADRSPLELSFLHPHFSDLQQWQKTARAKVFEHLFYSPPPVAPKPDVVRRVDRGDYVEEYLTLETAPGSRVPAFLLLPAKVTRPVPALLVLHCHGGFYVWGKEKVVHVDNEHAALTDFKRRLYEGRSIATELVRRGYVVMTTDMFFWGERRMLLDDDPAVYKDRERMTTEDVAAFNRRSQQAEQLVARSLFTAGITWPGVILWDDIRALDYLASRPEVDAERLGCVGLSVGGYRSYVLAALDERIKAAVDVGWMTSFASNIRRHVVNTVGFSFHLVGLYRYLDFPDLAALIAPRRLLVMNGAKDGLFPLDGVDAAFKKIEACFRKAGAPDHQQCRMYDVPHQFNAAMQADAWQWLERSLP